MLHAKPNPPEKTPQDLDILHSLASMHVLYGQHDKAIALLRLAVSLDPENAKTTTLIAYAALRHGDLEAAAEAIEHLERIGAVIPRELQARRRLASIARQGKDETTARRA